MSDVKLMLHTGATMVSEEELEHLREPTGSTETHIKLGHPEYLDMVKGELDKRHIGYRKGEFAITPSNECMFGLIPLEEFSIPSIDARNLMYVDTPLPAKDRHSLLVRLCKKKALPPSQMLDVENEYNKPPEEAIRDQHSYSHNVWRFLQSYTQNLRTEGKFRTAHSRLDAIAFRTQRACTMLTRYCDPNGERMNTLLSQECLFSPGTSVTQSYKYVLGVRNSNDKQFAAGLVMGIAPFVCDNLCFSGEVKVSHRHTRNVMSNLPGRIGQKLDELFAHAILN